MKLIVNCGVDPRIRLTKSTTSDMAWVWVGYDFSDGVELVQETFCLKATTPEDATKFKEAFEMAQEEMKKLMGNMPNMNSNILSRFGSGGIPGLGGKPSKKIK